MSLSMEKKIYWGVAAVSLLVLIVSFVTADKSSGKEDLPWFIEHPTADTTRIFGLTLGKSTTDDAELRFKETAVPSLFKSKEGKLVAEVFFEQVDLAGLRSKVVLNIAVSEAEIQGMYERGLRLSATGSGKKITLAPDDVTRLRQLPIIGLTYSPSVALEESIFAKRFGQPNERVKENTGELVHWLYPQHGLDITLSPHQKPLMQYVQPKDFDLLRAPLLANGTLISP